MVNYRILGLSSLAQYVLTLAWGIGVATHTDGVLRWSFWQTFNAFIGPFLSCCAALGYVGHAADRCGKLLWRLSFHTPACAAMGSLPAAAYIPLGYFLKRSDIYFTIAVSILCSIASWSGLQLAMTLFYHFMTRRISFLHWLPQNRSEAPFDPWWSKTLRYVWIGYTLMLGGVFLATILSMRQC